MLQRFCTSLLAGAVGAAAVAQAPAPTPATADSPAVTAIVDAARTAAGSEWGEAVEFFCGNSGRPNRADDPEIRPTRVFDNLYALGRTSTVIWALTTPDSILLIDAGYPDQLESVLLPQLRVFLLQALLGLHQRIGIEVAQPYSHALLRQQPGDAGTHYAAADHHALARFANTRDPEASVLLGKTSGATMHAGGAPWPAATAQYQRVLALSPSNAIARGALDRIAPELDDKSVELVFTPEPEPLPMHAMYLPARRPPKVDAVIQFLVEKFSAVPWRPNPAIRACISTWGMSC